MKDSIGDSLMKYIVSTPDTLGGEPRIDGHRISVRNVLGYLSCMTVDEIQEDFCLSVEEIYAALFYAKLNPKGYKRLLKRIPMALLVEEE